MNFIRQTLLFAVFVLISINVVADDCLENDDSRLLQYQLMIEQEIFVQLDKSADNKNSVMTANVKLADTYAKRAAGFQYVCLQMAKMPVLFKFDEPRSSSFHMRNVTISLYMFFFDENGSLVNQYLMTPYNNAYDRTTYPSGANVLYGLEVPEHLVEKNPNWLKLHSIYF